MGINDWNNGRALELVIDVRYVSAVSVTKWRRATTNHLRLRRFTWTRSVRWCSAVKMICAISAPSRFNCDSIQLCATATIPPPLPPSPPPPLQVTNNHTNKPTVLSKDIQTSQHSNQRYFLPLLRSFNAIATMIYCLLLAKLMNQLHSTIWINHLIIMISLFNSSEI